MIDEVLPNWIIAGAPKSSTSSVFRWLVDHPQVDGPLEKETYYFMDPGTHMFRPQSNFRDHGIGGYERHFSNCNASAKVVVESTPGYFYSQTALRELPKLRTRPSFVFVIRDPVSQLRSLFTYFQQNWNWIPREMSFSEFISTVEHGRSNFGGNELATNALSNAWYSDHLRRWQAVVGQDRMFLLLFDDVVNDSRGTMRRVADLMGIDPSFYDTYDFVPENSTYVARSARLQDLNILVRGLLPKGRLYNAMRRIYRAANTCPPNVRHCDHQAESLLAERYIPMLAELEQEFELDLAEWRTALHAKLVLPAKMLRDVEIEQPQLSFPKNREECAR